MSKFREVLNNIILRNGTDRNDLYHRIFVVSAYNNVTNWLLEHKKTKEPGIYQKFVNHENFNQAMEELLERLIEINRPLRIYTWTSRRRTISSHTGSNRQRTFFQAWTTCWPQGM